MARKDIVITTYTDDLTGEEFTDEEITTVEFSYSGRDFRIDLGPENATKLDDLLAPYIDKAEKVTAKTNKSSGNTDKKERPGILAWAKEKKLVKDTHRGRIPNDVIAAYDAAH